MIISYEQERLLFTDYPFLRDNERIGYVFKIFSQWVKNKNVRKEKIRKLKLQNTQNIRPVRLSRSKVELKMLIYSDRVRK